MNLPQYVICQSGPSVYFVVESSFHMTSVTNPPSNLGYCKSDTKTGYTSTLVQYADLSFQ